MVTFRFYLVSLVAVFLALAMGVVVGSTLIDRAIVDRLDRSVETVRDRADRAQEENDRLEEELAELRDFGEGTAPAAVAGTLPETAVVVVAERGVDPDPVRATVALLAAAGADSPGVLWVEPAWALEEQAQLDALAGAIDVPTEDPEALRDRAWRRVVQDLQGTSVTGEPLDELIGEGFLAYDAVEEGSEVDDLAGSADGVLFVTGPASELRGAPTVEMGRILVDEELATVVGEVWREEDEGPARGASLQLVRDDEDLTGLVSTVDALDLVEGRVAAVWAVAGGPPGNYGVGPGADRLLPERPRRPAP